MKKKILVRGPALSQSGYGEQTRFILRALKTREDIFDIFFINISWGNTNFIVDDNEERRWLHSLLGKTVEYSRQNLPFDISVQVTVPNEFEKIAPINIGFTAGIETTKVAPVWLQKTNEMVDRLMVVSNHSKNVFEKTSYPAKNDQTGEEVIYKLQTPVDVINFATRPIKTEKVELDLKHDFNYLVVSQWGPRKNLENTIRWFVEENIDQEVGLILKVNKVKNCNIDREFCTTAFRNLLSHYENRKCSVTLVHGYMTDSEMRGLITHPKVKAMINISHGEGFGLPLFEAAQLGLPVISVDWSGQTDFLYAPKKDKKTKKIKNRSHFVKVDYSLAPIQDEAIWDGVLQKDSQWAFVREGSYKMKLREVRSNYEVFKGQATRLKKWVLKNFTEEEQYKKAIVSISKTDPSLMSLVKQMERKPSKPNGISFCIPTNGARADITKLTIKSIKKQKWDIPYEILVCGDITGFRKSKNVKLIDCKEFAHTRRVASMRNRAADESKYDVICFLDDDIILSEDWLEKTLDFCEKRSWEILSNKILLPTGGRYWDRAILQPHIMVSYEHSEYDKNLYQTSCFMMVQRDVFKQVRWDDKKLVYADREGQIPEDVQYSLDLHEAGFGFSFNPEALVWHYDDSYAECFTGNNYHPGPLCLKRDILTKEYGLEFFPPHLPEFKRLASFLRGVR